MKPFKVLKDLCTGCGLCVKQCPRPKVVLKEGKAFVTNSNDCIACGHCYAVCPTQALLAENEQKPHLLKDTSYSFENLVALFEKRRSHRLYQKKELSLEVLLKLEELAKTAPTGTNARSLQFIWVQGEEKIAHLTKGIMKVYQRLKKLMNNPIIRFLVGLFDQRAKSLSLRRDLNRMVHRYQKGEDPLFHFAPCVLLVCALKEESSTPQQDADFALYQMVLGAETLNIGTCINGLALIGFKFNKKLKKFLKFKKNLKPYACATFGYPEYPFVSKVFHDPFLSNLQNFS